VTLSDAQVPSILAAFDLGSWGRLSDGPVASGRLGSIWRLDSEAGSWAVKQVGDVSPGELAELLEGAAFHEAALAAGVPAPAVRRTRAGELIAACGGVRAQLSRIVAEGCRRWLDATTAGERRDNEGWVREFVDSPLTRAVIEALLATP
jgi:hypothetical protein